jgi:hypothetical protein
LYVARHVSWSGGRQGADRAHIRSQIHHTFTLAELFTMSGFYLTLNTIQTGFHAAEESVRMFDSILGSNESSRALSSIITLVRTELTREDSRFGPTGLLAEQDRETEEKQHKKGTISSLTALTKALTAFACLQMATHRRTLRELKQRVVYDCTVVIDRQENTVPSQQEQDAPSTSADLQSATAPLLRSPLVDPTPNFAGKYAGPPNPPRRGYSATLSPMSPLDALPNEDETPRPLGTHRRTSSATSMITPAYSPGLAGPLPRSTSFGHRTFDDHILTDVRGKVESRTASIRMRSRDSSMPSSPSRSRRTSVAFDLAGLGLSMTAERPRNDRDADAIFDARPESEVTEKLSRLCGSPITSRSRAASHGGHLYDEEQIIQDLGDDSCMSCDEEVDMTGDNVESLPPEVQAILDELEAQYAAADRSTASPSSLGAATYCVDPVYSSGTHVVQTAGGDYSFEIEIEETVTTMTTTVRTIEQVGEDKVVRRETKPRLNRKQLEADSGSDPPGGSSARMDVDDVDDAGDEYEWIEIPSRRSSKSPRRPQPGGQDSEGHGAAAESGSTIDYGKRDTPKLQVRRDRL